MPPETLPWVDQPRCVDLTRTRAYQERYQYDPMGNMVQLRHEHTLEDGTVQGRNRDFTLVTNGAAVPLNNRLATVTIGRTDIDYLYDENGNMTQEGLSRHFEWDHSDQMKAFRTQTAAAEPSIHEYLAIVQDRHGWLKYRIFSTEPVMSKDDGHWRTIAEGDFAGAFAWPDTPDVFVFYVSEDKTKYAIVNQTNALVPGGWLVQTPGVLEAWLVSAVGVSLTSFILNFDAAFQLHNESGGVLDGVYGSGTYAGNLLKLLELTVQTWDFNMPEEADESKAEILKRFQKKGLDQFLQVLKALPDISFHALNVTLLAGGDITVNANIATRGGGITLTSTGGNIDTSLAFLNAGDGVTSGPSTVEGGKVSLTASGSIDTGPISSSAIVPLLGGGGNMVIGGDISLNAGSSIHADFRSGPPENSYIQLWDRRVPPGALRELGLADEPTVELLTLSACRTALGDREAELGFAGLAVQTGAKSALGSLWSVNDEGTMGLMTSFYEQLKQAPIKAEALRQAQLAMIRGDVRLEDAALVTPGGRFPLPAALAKQLGDRGLSHPYYWSAFTMVGSPW